ncbi:hypothetical protein BLOT_009338 [Blomia tropicalis]|nr:hypothetical protein BLOT_009338 [Blomia tropicalis]
MHSRYIIILGLFVNKCQEHFNFGKIDNNKKTKATNKTHLIEQIKTTKSKKPKQLIIATFVKGLIAIGTLVFGYEAVQFAKIFYANYQTAIEQTKLVQADILRIQQQSINNQLFRELTRELQTFEIATKMKEYFLETSTILKDFIGKTTNKQDFSKEFKVVFGDIHVFYTKNK